VFALLFLLPFLCPLTASDEPFGIFSRTMFDLVAKAHPGIYSNSVPEAKDFYGYA
jgi:hypothetical protein